MMLQRETKKCMTYVKNEREKIDLHLADNTPQTISIKENQDEK